MSSNLILNQFTKKRNGQKRQRQHLKRTGDVRREDAAEHGARLAGLDVDHHLLVHLLHVHLLDRVVEVGRLELRSYNQYIL